MRLRCLTPLALVVPFALTWTSCVATRSVGPETLDERPVLLVDAQFPVLGERLPVGWIYAFDDVEGRKNRCVYIWSDESWSLAEETSPGYFGDQLTMSCMGPANETGMAPALDFPADALLGWRDVYVAGGIAATYNGKAIPRK